MILAEQKIIKLILIIKTESSIIEEFLVVQNILNNYLEEYLDPTDLAGLIARASREEGLKEIHRLSQTVHRITSEAYLVPKEAYKLQTGNFLRINANFTLTVDQKNNPAEKKDFQEVNIIFSTFV